MVSAITYENIMILMLLYLFSTVWSTNRCSWLCFLLLLTFQQVYLHCWQTIKQVVSEIVLFNPESFHQSNSRYSLICLWPNTIFDKKNLNAKTKVECLPNVYCEGRVNGRQFCETAGTGVWNSALYESRRYWKDIYSRAVIQCRT